MDYRRAHQKGGLYFFTLVTHRRQPFFSDPGNAQALQSAFEHVQIRHPFVITAHVVLPDHVHFLMQLPETEDDFSTRIRLVKHFVTRKSSSRPFWQNRFWEHLIRDEDDFRNHLDYIHINPVKHGWADDPAAWAHSSFAEHVEKGWYAPGWGKEALRLEGDFGE